MVLGITGKIGAGKSTVQEFISDKYDTKVIVLDDLAKDILKDKNVYTKDIVKEDEFLSTDELEYMKKYIHPLVWDEVNKLVEKYKSENAKIILIETALPTEAFFNICDKTILVENDNFEKLLRINRKYTDKLISEIIKSQLIYESFYQKCDYKILNDCSLEVLNKKVEDLCKEIIKD